MSLEAPAIALRSPDLPRGLNRAVEAAAAGPIPAERSATGSDLRRSIGGGKNPTKVAAQAAVAAGQKGSSVWFKHMRKAGGSTVLKFLEQSYQLALNRVAKGERPASFTLHHQGGSRIYCPAVPSAPQLESTTPSLMFAKPVNRVRHVPRALPQLDSRACVHYLPAGSDEAHCQPLLLRWPRARPAQCIRISVA